MGRSLTAGKPLWQPRLHLFSPSTSRLQEGMETLCLELCMFLDVVSHSYQQKHYLCTHLQGECEATAEILQKVVHVLFQD